jgi:murein DD-endopeptidase MepM/ murein hydrolase activator NlpD
VPARAEPERAPAPRFTQGTPVPPSQARIINAPAEQRTAALGDRRNDATAPAPAPAQEAASGKFRWPARGKVIAAFGKRTDGTHNDGINIAMPQGTDVHAAESGRVAYAGNELKGYGNLVLIRHDNGWVSAYAHADQVLVKRDDIVRRGQVIAKAGKTGTVDQPQLHFELRQGAKPVDPMPHMEK